MLRRAFLPILAGAAAVLVAACGSSSTTSSSAAAAPPASSSSSGAASSSSSSSAAAGGVTLTASTSSLGTFLVDPHGMTLYLFEADTSSASTCSGACASTWPPLITTGAPVAGSGVTASLLGTTSRSDGTTQVTYKGHPLYGFVVDKQAGDTKGQGVNGFGALWWVVDASTGDAITKK